VMLTNHRSVSVVKQIDGVLVNLFEGPAAA